jgi:hypothetical protein
MKLKLILGASILLFGSMARASIIVNDDFHGWYQDFGQESGGNIFAGSSPDIDGASIFHNYFTFDLSAAAGCMSSNQSGQMAS